MLTVGLLALAPVFAQSGQAEATGQAGQSGAAHEAHQAGGSANRLASGDHTFVMKAAEGGLAEVALGNLAKDKASDPAVKSFGQQMVDDHSKANDELKQLASSKGITLPAEPNAKDKAEHDRLAKLSGEAFDKAYMRAMVSDHRTDVNEFRKESQSGADSDLKAWAAKTLPTLEHHLQMAESTDAKVKK